MAKTKFFGSIRFRFSAAFALLLMFGIGLITYGTISLVERHVVAERVDTQSLVFRQKASGIADNVAAANTDSLLASVSALAKDMDGRVLYVDTNKTVLLDTLSELSGTTFYNEDIERVLNGETAFSYTIRTEKVDGKDMRTVYYSQAIAADGSTRGVLIAAVSIQDVYDSVTNLAVWISLVTVGIGIAIMLIQLFITAHFTRQIDAITGAIRRVEKGDFAARASVHTSGELAELALSYNTMIQRLENIDASRNKFVSDASHELKTPLASIKILVDALLQQENVAPEVYKEFLTDITSEIDRLNYVINDLLTLVRIDKKSDQITLAPTKISALLSRNVHLLTPIADIKGIGLSLHIEEEVTLACDQIKLQQAFYNIIENAIKYSAPGTEVTVRLLRRGTDAVVEVQDRGFGIPAADLPHIFERFYRVDRARKKGSGTGLGLAITDGIIKLHNGVIEVESAEEKGSLFRVVLPLQ